MKILFLQNINNVSGSELLLAQMMPLLKAQGVEVEMLVIHKTLAAKDNHKWFVDTLRKDGIIVYGIYGHHPASPALQWKIHKILQKGKYDVAHCNLPHADFWMAIQKLFFWHKLKLVSVKHGFDELLLAKHPRELHKLRNSIFAWVQRLTGIFVRKNVAISRFIYDLYIEGKISRKSKTTVIFNGIDTTPRVSSGYERKIPNPYAVIVGRLIKYKGHEYLIEAWRSVKEANPSLRLAILGKGAYDEQLKQKVKECALEEQIIFMGHQDPHPFFHFSRFSIVSSLCEPFGLITLESWLHKKPVVAFDVPAINEVIENNINGILVEPFNTNELANQIMYMFEHTEACSKMGEKGYEKSLQEYNLQKMTAQYMSVYNEVIKR